LHHLRLAMIFFGDLFDGRREQAARATPRRPKIHQYRPVRLHNFGFPIRITNLSDKLTHFFLLKSYNCSLTVYHYTVSTSGLSARALYQTPPFSGTQTATRRRGDWAMRRGSIFSFSLSPCLLVSPSPSRPVAQSPRLLVALSPRRPVAQSPPR